MRKLITHHSSLITGGPMARAETSIAPTERAARPATSPLASLRQNAGRVALYALLLLFGLIFAFPFYWVITASIKDVAEIRAIPPTFWPQSFTLEGYTKVWSDKFARYFIN